MSAIGASNDNGFAEPDWRGQQDCAGQADRTLRPLVSLAEQEAQLDGWITGGAAYGWLNAYEARRAAFELQSIRAQRWRDPFTAATRRAVQSRLDRLEAVLRCTRTVVAG
jgi:hypothetical protein